jgi:hypothetical protein
MPVQSTKQQVRSAAWAGGSGAKVPVLHRATNGARHGFLAMRSHRGGFLGRGCSMSAPGSRAKCSSSSVKGRPRSLSIASNILRSSSLSFWRAARRSGVSGGDGSSGSNIAINAAAVAKLPSFWIEHRQRHRRAGPSHREAKPALTRSPLGIDVGRGSLTEKPGTNRPLTPGGPQWPAGGLPLPRGEGPSGLGLAAENTETKTPRRCGPTRGLGRAPQ